MVKRWFLASGGEGRETIYELFFAEPSSKAPSWLVNLPEGVRVTDLSWRGLSELTGCEIPQHVSPEHYATEMISLLRDGRRVRIHGGDGQ